MQFFWNLLELSDSVEQFYLAKQQGELEWIRGAIGWWRNHDDKTIPAPVLAVQQLMAQKDLVWQFWVNGQLNYFTKAGPREKGKGERCKHWGVILFWTSLLLAVILGGCEVWHTLHATPGPEHEGLPPEEAALVFAISMLLTGAAIAVAYGEKMAFSEHSRQYGATSNLFRHYASQLTAGPLTPEEIELFRTLGKEALWENGDWLLLHRDRPLEIVVP